MFGMNAKLDPEIQTIFLPASENTQFIASKLVKEIAKLDGEITKFVPKSVADRLKDKLKIS
jgi:pantetheine-phosphate adenylyltransferase